MMQQQCSKILLNGTKNKQNKTVFESNRFLAHSTFRYVATSRMWQL